MSPSVLIVDDDRDMCRLLETGLGSAGFESESCTSVESALQRLRAREYDVVVADVRMRDGNGLELCSRIGREYPEIPVIVITAFGSMEAAIDAIRAGAFDFVPKPFELDAMRLRVRRAVEHRALRRRIERLEEVVTPGAAFEGLLGSSAPMRELYDLVARVAASDAAVLVAGESGTGKELIARALHARSPRRAGPFVPVNCAAMPETLLESELFGHVKGAFTDARASRPGLFAEAHGGTLFLDEIGELPLGLQPKLLRALQERVVRPIGGSEERSFDARLVAASNRDLEAAVEQGRFRADLYYRIQVIQIDLPPLRIRGGDALLLAQHFAERFAARAGRGAASLAPEAARLLLRYPWPGNVRELQNCMERAVVLSRDGEISPEDLPERLRDHEASPVAAPVELEALESLDAVERRHILQVFEAAAGNKSLAARVLGLDRKTLYRKLVRFGAIGEGTEDSS